jgi:hypothetical protein
MNQTSRVFDLIINTEFAPFLSWFSTEIQRFIPENIPIDGTGDIELITEFLVKKDDYKRYDSYFIMHTIPYTRHDGPSLISNCIDYGNIYLTELGEKKIQVYALAENDVLLEINSKIGNEIRRVWWREIENLLPLKPGPNATNEEWFDYHWEFRKIRKYSLKDLAKDMHQPYSVIRKERCEFYLIIHEDRRLR